MSRPTNHSEKLEEIAWDYVKNFKAYGDETPMIVGLSRVINRSRSTIYEWIEKKTGAFPDIAEAIAERQQIELCNKGLTGEFNSSITKLMLSKHGFAEKQEVDQNLTVEVVQYGEDN